MPRKKVALHYIDYCAPGLPAEYFKKKQMPWSKSNKLIEKATNLQNKVNMLIWSIKTCIYALSFKNIGKKMHLTYPYTSLVTEKYWLALAVQAPFVCGSKQSMFFTKTEHVQITLTPSQL